MITADYINSLIDVTVSDQSLTSEEVIAMIKTLVRIAIPIQSTEDALRNELERECEKQERQQNEMHEM